MWYAERVKTALLSSSGIWLYTVSRRERHEAVYNTSSSNTQHSVLSIKFIMKPVSKIQKVI